MVEDFDMVSSLGKGSFGTVKLARHKNSGSQYAIKCISKESIKGDKHI